MAEEIKPQREGFGEGLFKRQRVGEGSRQKIQGKKQHNVFGRL